ncbi:hypothetical protein F5051DRAFT_431893 [Lentinula edodes]|nr:hypothetical protein F5051DRAFT_431893 [Lentinula edodes]
MSKEPKWQNDWPVPSTIFKSSIHLFANSSLTIPLNDESTKENMDAKLEGVTTSNLNYIRARRTKRSFEATSEATVIPPIPYYLHSYLRALGPKLTPQLKEILDATETPDDHDAPRNRSPDLMPPYETWFGQQDSYGIEQEPPIELRAWSQLKYLQNIQVTCVLRVTTVSSSLMGAEKKMATRSFPQSAYANNRTRYHLIRRFHFYLASLIYWLQILAMKIMLLTTVRKRLTTSTILRIPQKLNTAFEEIATCDDANHFNFFGSIDYRPHTASNFPPRKS